MFGDIYKDRTVLVTGHTGFKGSWLSLWLRRLGARVVGYALEPATDPNHFDLLRLDMASTIGDIRDRAGLEKVFETYKPEVVFHLAAQPLVRASYLDPVTTLETNVIGTANVLEACRTAPSVRAVVNITSDKCYENREWLYGYREIDPMGGYDPYSASKGCAELVTNSYRRSFFSPEAYGKKHGVLLASARAGNIIGGGDWSTDRLVPDMIRAAVAGAKVSIRSPRAIRPWQHVLDPLAGYLMLGRKLLEGDAAFADAWNFGPDEASCIEVERIVKGARAVWDRIDYEKAEDPAGPHEAGLLKLDCSKARTVLGWRPLWKIEDALDATVGWYREFYASGAARSALDLDRYSAALSARASS